MYTRKQLTECLWNAGLKPTDTVLVHSSATSVGEVENGTSGILDVFIDCFSREGLLIFPALTYTLPQMRRSGKILLCPRARSARRPEISRGHALLRRKTAESVPETSGRCAFAVGVKFRRRARTRCRVLRIRARTVRERLLPGLPLVETAGAQRENSPDRSSSQPDDLFSRRVRMDDA